MKDENETSILDESGERTDEEGHHVQPRDHPFAQLRLLMTGVRGGQQQARADDPGDSQRTQS